MATQNAIKSPAPVSQRVEDYYDICWSQRFAAGHNPHSLAIHLGYYGQDTTDSEAAKIALNKLIAEKISGTIKPGAKVIDAGCGVGGTCLYLAKNYPFLNIQGLNLSAKQLDMARNYALNAGVSDRIEFIQADYCDSGLPGKSADAIYAIESICHAEVKRKFFDEAYRLLRPDGMLVIADYVEADFAATSSRDYEDFCRGWEVGRYLAEPAADLRKTGFTSLVCDDITDKVYPGIVRSHDNALMQAGKPDWADQPEMMQNHLRACIALKRLVDRGDIRYCVITCIKPDNCPA